MTPRASGTAGAINEAWDAEGEKGKRQRRANQRAGKGDEAAGSDVSWRNGASVQSTTRARMMAECGSATRLWDEGALAVRLSWARCRGLGWSRCMGRWPSRRSTRRTGDQGRHVLAAPATGWGRVQRCVSAGAVDRSGADGGQTLVGAVVSDRQRLLRGCACTGQTKLLAHGPQARSGGPPCASSSRKPRAREPWTWARHAALAMRIAARRHTANGGPRAEIAAASASLADTEQPPAWERVPLRRIAPGWSNHCRGPPLKPCASDHRSHRPGVHPACEPVTRAHRCSGAAHLQRLREPSVGRAAPL